MNLLENELSVAEQDLELFLRGHQDLPWSDHLLNQTNLCGSDFLIQWSQIVWSKKRLMAAINSTGEFFVLPYGPSSAAPDSSPREFDFYFGRLKSAGAEGPQRPDFLILRKQDEKAALELVQHVGGVEQLPFTTEEVLTELLRFAVLAIRRENSLSVVAGMPDYGKEMKRQHRKGVELGEPKNAVMPAMIIKQEDIAALKAWQDKNHVPIHIWHLFFDLAFGIGLDRALRLIQKGTVSTTRQLFQKPSGATTVKTTYKIDYHYGYFVGESLSRPTLKAAYAQDRSGHTLPYVRLEGGELLLQGDALNVVREASVKI